MKHLLAIASTAEALTGLLLVVAPSLVTGLLLGAGVAGPGAAVARVAGFGLIGLGRACWPSSQRAGLEGMLIYSTLAALYLGYIGIAGAGTGKLLWPAVAGHMILTILLVRTWLGVRVNERNGSVGGIVAHGHQ